MKTKTTWKTLAGLALAAGVWRKFSEDLPVHAGPPGTACGLTYSEIQTKLNQIETDWSLGLYTRSEYLTRRNAMQKCLSELMEAA